MSSARPSSSVDKSNDDGGDYLGREIKEAVAGDQPVVEKKPNITGSIPTSKPKQI